jgi:hypothetical protein
MCENLIRLASVFTFSLLLSFVTHLCFNSVARVHPEGSHDEQWYKKLVHHVEGHLENVNVKGY